MIDNKVIVAQPPDMIVYTDVDRNLRFDPAVDKREVLAHRVPGGQLLLLAAFGDRLLGTASGWAMPATPWGRPRTSPGAFRMFSAYRPGPGLAVQVPARPGAPRKKAERRRARLHRRVHCVDESMMMLCDQWRHHRQTATSSWCVAVNIFQDELMELLALPLGC